MVEPITYDEALRAKLRVLAEGLRTLGVRPYLIEEAIDRLDKQERELARIKGTSLYQAGLVEGRAQVWATGLVGDDDA